MIAVLAQGRMDNGFLCMTDRQRRTGQMPESFLYNPGITNKVMQGAFFPIKCHHQIANSKRQGADNFGQAPSQGS